MSYLVSTTKRFDRSVRKCIKRGLDVELLKEALAFLIEDGMVPQEYRPHKLSGNFSSCWECHIQPDWLLIWQRNDDELTLLLVDTGTHSDLFR